VSPSCLDLLSKGDYVTPPGHTRGRFLVLISCRRFGKECGKSCTTTALCCTCDLRRGVLTADGCRLRYSLTTTGSPTLTVLKYHSASAGLRLMQPWLTFSSPSDWTAHGAECTNSPRLLIRSAKSTGVL